MLPNDNQTWDPTVRAYLEAQQKAQADQDAANQGAMTQDMIGAGTDVASALFSHPSKQAVLLQHYNDSSAPKLTQQYQPKTNGDAARQVGADMRAAGVAKKASDLKNAGQVAELQDKAHSRSLADNADSRAQSGEERSKTTFDHTQSRQAGDDAFTDASRKNQTDEFAASAERRDPNSQTSQDFKKFVGKVAPDLANSLGNMSYEDASKAVPGMVNAYESRKAREQSAQISADGKKAVQAEKGEAASDKNYTQMRKDLESFRGNAAAQQASKDVLSADKALQIVKGKDPNHLTNQDLSLLAGELAKVATGGVPTEHGIQTLMPNNLATKAAELQSFLSSKPTDAQAGEYIKKNMAYLEEMRDTAHKTLNSYRTNIAKGYKSRVKPESYSEAVNDYGLGEQPPAAPGQPSAQITHGADLP